jgi:hypothetical protein
MMLWHKALDYVALCCASPAAPREPAKPKTWESDCFIGNRRYARDYEPKLVMYPQIDARDGVARGRVLPRVIWEEELPVGAYIC